MAELREAVSRSDLRSVELILARGGRNANVNDLYMGLSAVHLAASPSVAARDTDLQVLNALLEVEDAEIDGRDLVGATALHRLCRVRTSKSISPDLLIQLIETLVAAGANTNSRQALEWDQTPLMMASRACHPSVLSALLDAGAESCWRDRRDETALHIACTFGQTENVKVLIEHMQRILATTTDLPHCLSVRSTAGRTPLDSLHLPDGQYFGSNRARPEISVIILRAYATHLARAQGSMCLHHVLHQVTVRDADIGFVAPVGTLDTASIATLLKALVAQRGDSVNNLRGGLLPLHVACGLDFPLEIVYVLLRSSPTTL